MVYYRLRNTLFLLFAVSGFTGLIYESIWSHYLKLFLGHAAYAQALVLAIFMGGMALGAWLASRWVAKWSNLLMAYALVEGIIGFMGIVFHPVFTFILDISFGNIIPVLDSPAIVQLYKWTVSALLILPQSVLLGMTFPLMSNGIIRLWPQMQGRSLAMLYFSNSLGAAIGVLVAGFVLIAAAGLPGTILFAGLVNVVLAIIVYGLAKGRTAPAIREERSAHLSAIPLLLLGAAFITGMASFIYEIAWIRMLSMVLGASTHSFELMLSAFILGLALGGLFIRRHIDNLSDPVLTAGMIQIVMGICALGTVALYNYTFDVMAFFMSALKPTDAGYNLYTFASHFIALLVMLPATFCAGMTLPLFTKILLAWGCGEKSIGQVYASNTLGAIMGVAFTIFIAMPVLGLKNTMATGAGLDVILGLVLLIYSGSVNRRSVVVPMAAFLVLIFSGVSFIDFDFKKMSSTVFRTGEATVDENYSLLFQKDGKTSSVHVTRHPEGYVTISTNGKPDALINMEDNELIGADEPTMVMIAAIPLAINPEIKMVANIGMGSGLTTHTLLAWPGIEQVDTIEIEPAMVEGANHFRPRVERAFIDPRSHIHIEDAKTYFSNHRKKYDLITSEPSNPWVSGVSSLFTDEFYGQVRKYLTDDGMFMQWLQPYEINLQLVLSVLKALDNNFNYYNLFAASDGDLFIVAKENSPIDIPQTLIFTDNNMRRELSLIGVHGVEDIKARFLANEKLIRPLLKTYNPTANSDYFPVLDLNAARSRFKREDAYDLTRIRLDPIPLINMLVPEYENENTGNISEGYKFSTSKRLFNARNIYDFLIFDKQTDVDIDYGALRLLRRLARDCGPEADFDWWASELVSLAHAIVPYLTPAELNRIWDLLTPPCLENPDNSQSQWLTLVKALGQRDVELIADTTTSLLQKNDPLVQQQKKLLFGSLMLALVKLGECQIAIQLWPRFIDDLFDEDDIPISLQILYGLALQNNSHGCTGL